MEPRIALSMREEPGLGAEVKRWNTCWKVCGGHQRGELWKKEELERSWKSLDGKLLRGIKLEGRNEQESSAHP